MANPDPITGHAAPPRPRTTMSRRTALALAVAVAAVAILPLLMMALSAITATPSRAAWIDGERARLQALDKVTARISTLEAPIDQAVRFGTLSVMVRRCAYHPPEEQPEDAAFLEIVDNGHDDTKPPSPVFTGWMFSSSPAISAMEHPVYDITLLECGKR